MNKDEEKIKSISDMIKEHSPIPPKQGRAKVILKFTAYAFIFFAVAFLVFSTKAMISNDTGESWLSRIPIIGTIKHLAESADKDLKGEDRDRINILLLGMGGSNHEGGYLTDTIILASLEPSTEKVAMLSIPRDMSIPVEGMGWTKINAINAYAEAENKGSGGLAISQAISDILNMPIDYYARVDFAGFINIVDELGGVNVYVDNTLEDYSYPIMGEEENEVYENRFEHLYLEKGWQEMDGSLALKYARSRHAYGIEGSDFARAKRQQKIIMAVKEKLMDKYILFKPTVITNIINEIQEHFSTNLKIWEIIKLYDIFKNVSSDNVVNKVLDNGPNGLLRDTISESGAYILIPTSGDFAEIQYLVNNIFDDAPRETQTKVKVESSTVEVRNGTWINGLASQAAVDLEKYGFDVIRIGNSSRQNFQKSVVYDLTYGNKIDSLAVLKEKTGANVAFELPDWLIEDIKQELINESNPIQPDFILILGQDADKTSSGAENLEK